MDATWLWPNDIRGEAGGTRLVCPEDVHTDLAGLLKAYRLAFLVCTPFGTQFTKLYHRDHFGGIPRGVALCIGGFNLGLCRSPLRGREFVFSKGCHILMRLRLQGLRWKGGS